MKTAFLTLALLCFMMVGCEPATGPGGVATDPNAPTPIEIGAEAAITLTQVLGALWPPLIPIATAAGGVFAGYKRLKPKLQEAQQTSDKYYAAGETLTSVLEDIKTNEPELWAKIGPRIKAATSSKAVTAIENTIREFRALEPKPEAPV